MLTLRCSVIHVSQVRTIFWHKIWKGVVLPLLPDSKDLTYRREIKYSALVFLPDKQTSGCIYKVFYANRWKYQKYPVSCSLHALKRQNEGRNSTSSSLSIKTFSNCYFVDISVSFKEKQHHFKFHPTWARGAQFGEGSVLAVHLSESVSPFAQNVRPWQHIYFTAQDSKL